MHINVLEVQAVLREIGFELREEARSGQLATDLTELQVSYYSLFSNYSMAWRSRGLSW